MQPVTIVKLGGSAITEKSKDCTPNLPLIHNVAEQIASFKGKMILLHGGGSYAHPSARRAQLQKGFHSKNQLPALSEIELQLDELSRIIGVSLLLSGVWFVPIKPMSFMTLRSGRLLRCFLDPIATALKTGVTPLIHGDIVFDVANGFGIISADRIASILANTFRTSRVLFGTDVDGVFTKNPKRHRQAEMIPEVRRTNYKQVLRGLKESSGSDVSGGMHGKVLEAVNVARRGCQASIFNLKKQNALRDMLAQTRLHGTTFIPWK